MFGIPKARFTVCASSGTIFGKWLQATREVHAQFRRRTVSKSYLALAAGVPMEAEFVVDAPIDRHESDK